MVDIDDLEDYFGIGDCLYVFPLHGRRLYSRDCFPNFLRKGRPPF